MNILKHLIFIIILTFFIAFPSFSQTSEDVKNYIDRYNKLAMQYMVEYKIPASITLAQGIIESNSGKSLLSTEANNHFGIKCHEWEGATYKYDDDRRNECFRKYKSPEASYKDHAIFLTSRQRYNNLFKLDIDDYKGWAVGLKKAGYATNPKYAHLLIKTIEDNKLYQYDQLVLGKITKDELYNRKTVIVSKNKNKIELSKSEKERLGKKLKLNYIIGTCDCMNEANFVEMYSGRNIYSYNNVFATFVDKKENIYNISKDVKIPVRKLLKYNDLPRGSKVEYRDIIYLDYKNKRGKVKYHIVTNDNETLWSISQCYTVILKKLQKKNRKWEINEPIKVGTRIKLK